MTDEISAEWRRHRSGFSRTWLVSMYARKKVFHAGEGRNEALRNRIASAASNEAQSAAMEKDCHLLEAALIADHIVVSLDETVRALFMSVAARVGELKGVTWVNPDRPEENLLQWLQSGCLVKRARQLGFVREGSGSD